MEENKSMTLEELQQGLIDQIGSGEMTDTESEAVRGMFDSVNKAIAEQRKAENERLRIEAESARAARDAEVAEERSKRELVGDAIRAGGQIGAAAIAGFVSVVSVARIINAEDHDKLVLSKALGFVLKPRG